MINTSDPFKSRLTDNINRFIQQTKPTRNKPIDSTAVAQAALEGQEISPKSLGLIRAYLNGLVGKKLLSAYGTDHAASVMPRIYFIDQPHQQAYWER